MGTDTEIVPQSTEVSGAVGVREILCIRFGQIASGRSILVVELGHACHSVDIIGVIEIKARLTGHGKDSARVNVHDDTGGIIGTVSLVLMILEVFVEFLQIFFADALNVRVQCQDEIIAVCRLDRRLLYVQGLIQISVGAAGHAVEGVVVVFLQAERPDIIAYGKADHIRGKCTAGIIADIVVLEPDPPDIGIYQFNRLRLGFIFSGLYRRLFCSLLCILLCLDALFIFAVEGSLVRIGQILEGYIVLRSGMFCYVSPDLFLVNAQSRHGIEGGLQVFSVVLQHLAGIYDHVVDQLAVRQNCPLAVRDPAAFIGQALVIIGLL